MPPEFLQLAGRVRNWGRWGADDEIGTLNFLTAERVRAAAGLVRRGARFALGLPLSVDGPQLGFVPGRLNPLRTMLSVNSPLGADPEGIRANDDVVVMGLQAATHWDALAHVSYGGRLYNGFDAATVTAGGAERCGIDKAGTVVGRGVLLDVARALGVPRVAGGQAIGPEELEAAEATGGARVGAGDIVLLRTGQMQLLHAGDRMAYSYPSPGPGMAAAEWFHDREVAAVATDNLTFEVFPGEREDAYLPVHLLHLVEMGLTQGQNFDLEALAADCADDGVYEFWLDATPQRFVAGLGSPVNPVAVK